ncbi:MAG: metallophosphoesterase [Deltaproteobacteria bacterium]|nr:metallophosphoesterase [Deltaproteobacteria bacterium]
MSGAASSGKGRVETIIVSDMHLADAEPEHPKRPHWKAFKQRRLFFDDEVERLLSYVASHAQGTVELILNGDIFDFDVVTDVPAQPPGPVSWISRVRGMPSEEWMSLHKIERIIADHPRWFAAVGAFLARGHRVVFTIGNHDVELNWPSVQARIRSALGGLEARGADVERVTFSGSFYLSGGDTFVTHGHLFDPYCTEKTPIDPLIRVKGRPRMRVPFGDMANRYMLNGMGYFNPHATNNYVMSLRQYVSFFFRYMGRDQPLLLFTWFWSALATLILTLRDFWTPAMRDPLLVDTKVQAIADRAQATPTMVRAIEALAVPSACTDPVKIIRELWLDRGLLFLLMLYGAFQVVLTVNFVWTISPWWLLLAIALFFPFFLMYSFKVRSAVFAEPLIDEQRAILIREITGMSQVVCGHTHEPELRRIGPLTFVNGGFWSPAFAEPACLTRLGTQTFVWLKPRDDGQPRVPLLLEWPPGGEAPKVFGPAAPSPASNERVAA